MFCLIDSARRDFVMADRSVVPKNMRVGTATKADDEHRNQ